MVARCLEAADALDEHGVSVRVVDLRSLSPLDTETIARCARETGRAVVVHEAPRTLGLGAEVTARIVEEAFDFLEAPVRRVTGYDVPYPPAALEHRYLPSEDRIVGAVREVVGY
jgi:pyruvate dehydrogenase E1 component beta subunit